MGSYVDTVTSDSVCGAPKRACGAALTAAPNDATTRQQALCGLGGSCDIFLQCIQKHASSKGCAGHPRVVAGRKRFQEPLTTNITRNSDGRIVTLSVPGCSELGFIYNGDSISGLSDAAWDCTTPYSEKKCDYASYVDTVTSDSVCGAPKRA